jgi:uncharacterized phage protein (TIGR02220 family)
MAKTNTELKQQAEELVGKDELARRFRVWITGLIKKESVKRSNLSLDEFFLNQAQMILDDLNSRTKGRFTLIDDFVKVHAVKAKMWRGDEKMERYLRPATLYQAGNFEGYLSEWHRANYNAKTQREQREARGDAERSDRYPTYKGDGDTFQQDRHPTLQAKEALVERLLARQWWEFDTFAEMVKWTVQFPDAASFARYNLPGKVAHLRSIKGVILSVYRDKVRPEIEARYQMLKEEYRQGD